jgi:hypothetical protein
MNINRDLLQQAAQAGHINAAQAESLWAFFSERTQHEASFKGAHILYYFGGMIAIGAMTLFMNLGFERFGGWGIFTIALIYGALALYATNALLARNLQLPAGILGALAVALVPLAIYGLQHALGKWPDGISNYRDYHLLIDWRWIVMELGTLVAGAILLWKFRLPFMVMPIAVTLWYMSMDFAPLFFGESKGYWEHRKVVSLFFGLAMIAFAFVVDLRSRREKDYAYWLYLFGVIAFWGGLSMMDSGSEIGKFLYFLINLAMIAIGGMLGRRVFAVFGAFGVAYYCFHLADKLFKDSMLFPFALTALGLLVVWLGVLWQRNELAIGARLQGFMPEAMREMVARR